MANIRVQKYVSYFSGGVFTRKTTAINNINKYIDKCISVHYRAKCELLSGSKKFSSREENYKIINALEVRIRDLIDARDHMVWVKNHKCK